MAAVAALLLTILAGGAQGALRALPEDIFPVPEGFQGNVDFWLDVFGRYSSDHVLLHHEDHPEIVYVVLDFGPLEESTLSDREKERRRRQELQAVESRYRGILTDLAAGREPGHGQEGLRVRELFRARGEGPSVYGTAVHRMRTQRGLVDRFREAVGRSGRVLPAMEEIFGARGLPLELTRLPFVESMFQEQARSRVGAGGVWQLMPGTARGLLLSSLEADERYDPLRATAAAAAILKQNHEALGNWPLAVTAYNAGLNGLVRAVRRLGTRDPGEVLRRHRSRIFGFASRNFYTEFLAAATIYENRDRFFPGVEPDPPLRFDRFVPDSYVAVGDLAAVAGISLETLRALNPGLSSEIWQGNLLWPEGYELRVPAGRLPDVQSAYRALPEAARSDRQTGFRYRVRRGDTLSVLARRFGTSVAAIQRANRLSRADFIREGQLLLIPPGGRVSVRYLPEGEAQAGGVHLVRSGDTLWAIAGRYGSCVEAIRSANDLSSSRIYAGQRLQIPPPSACSGAA